MRDSQLRGCCCEAAPAPVVADVGGEAGAGAESASRRCCAIEAAQPGASRVVLRDGEGVSD